MNVSPRSSAWNLSPALWSRPNLANTEKGWPWSMPQECDARSLRSVNELAIQRRPRWRDAASSMAVLTLTSRSGWTAATTSEPSGEHFHDQRQLERPAQATQDGAAVRCQWRGGADGDPGQARGLQRG